MTAPKKAAASTSSATPQHANLAAALAAFQAEMPTVHKGQTARIPGRDGRQGYSYNYADLADVASAAHPIMSRHGLSFTARPQHLDGVGFVLVGVLRHESGEVDEGMLPIVGRDAQAIGSSLTYNRRYLLGCMTGVVTDEDDDGSRAAQARATRPAAEQTDPGPAAESTPPPAEQPGGTRQQGRTQQPDAPAAGPDLSVVKAQTIAACKATDLAGLRAVWDQACEAGSVNSSIPDPDAPEGTDDRCTLGEFITRRRGQIEQQAAA